MSITDPSRSSRFRVLFLGSLSVLSAVSSTAGCKGCTNHKPYTPFGEESGAARSSASAAPPGSASSFQPVAGVSASGTTFDLDGTPIEAPSGKRFVSALPVDADGDGTSDLFAWLAPPDGRSGELWYVSGKDRGTGTTLAKLPAQGDGEACKASVTLNESGPATVSAVVVPGCEGGATSTYFAIARLARGASPVLRLDGSIGKPSGGEALSLAFDAKDRDGDGVDDLKMTVSMDGVASPFDATGKVSIPVLFLDRSAGFARDTSEPQATLAALGAAVMAKGRVAKVGDASLPDAAKLLRLATYTCEELGAPIVTTSAGPIRCGDTGFVADAIDGVGLAALTRKDYGAAITSLDVLASMKSDKHKRGADLEKAIAKSVPSVGATTLHVTSAKPASGQLSPLAFDTDGNLLVVTDTGVTQIAAVGFAEQSSGAAPWPLTVAWHDAGFDFGIVGAERTCSPRGLDVVGKVVDSTTRAALPTIEAALPSKGIPCVEGPLPLSVLLTDGSGAVLAAGSSVFKVSSQGSGIRAATSVPPDAKAAPSLPGQSRAFDGSATVLPIAGGVLVLGDKGAKRWMSDDLRDANHCVVRNGGGRVACVTPTGPGGVAGQPVAVVVEPK